MVTITVNGLGERVNATRNVNAITINPINITRNTINRRPLHAEPNVKEIIKMVKCAKLKKRIDQEDCPVCLCELNNIIVVPCCGVGFCKKCLSNSLKEREVCPTCRAEKCIKD